MRWNHQRDWFYVCFLFFRSLSFSSVYLSVPSGPITDRQQYRADVWNIVCHYVCYIAHIYDVCNVIKINLCTYIIDSVMYSAWMVLNGMSVSVGVWAVCWAVWEEQNKNVKYLTGFQCWVFHKDILSHWRGNDEMIKKSGRVLVAFLVSEVKGY